METFINIAHTQDALIKGEYSCQDLVHYYLQQIEARPSLNAFLEVYKEETLTRAKALDQKLANGEPLGKLFGVVIGVKDVICQTGHRVSAASNILEGFESLFSATAIERLMAADAIVIGRLNCDEFAMGSTNENSAFGPTRNAYDEQKVPGGSSGASAVAVQAGLCMAALGSDTGGSVRQPASFCDVIGVKPSYGRISRHGLIAYASSFDQIGPLTKSVADAALLLEVMAGKDDFDSTALQNEVPLYSQQLAFEGKAKIAYVKEVMEHPGLDEEIKEKMMNYLEQLRSEGHEVQAVGFPYLEYLVPTYYILTTAEASSNLARYDGARYGYRSVEAKNMEEVYRASRTEGFGEEVKRRIMLGTFVLSAGYYDAYYSKAQKARRLILEATKAILQTFDFIVTPTTPTTAFDLGDSKYQDPIAMYLADIYTVQANLVGMPALSLPLFSHSNMMPFGLQLMADAGEEANLLAFAHHLMEK